MSYTYTTLTQAIKDYSMSARELVMEFVRLYKKMNNPSTTWWILYTKSLHHGDQQSL